MSVHPYILEAMDAILDQNDSIATESINKYFDELYNTHVENITRKKEALANE